MDMSDIFKQYREILLEGIDKIRKSGYKKINLFRDMIETLEVFINKQAYGRIVPGNYVLLFILMMGSKQTKLLDASIRTMQKLFSYNYIHEHEELSTNLLKEDFKEYLLVDPATLKSKSVSEIYLQTLMGIQERDESTMLLVIKNLSLVVRLFQHCLSSDIIKNVFYYLTDILMNKSTNIDRTVKSTIIQVVRHILENLRQLDFNILVDNDSWSLKKVCKDMVTNVVDQICIKEAVVEKYGADVKWKLIPNPDSFDDFELFPVEVKNEKNVANGKFGWCVGCREAANYYCKILRVSVCSFACKTKYLSDSQDFDKLLADENRAQEFFLLHSKMIINCLSGELAHADQRRRALAIQIVNFVLAEPKRFKNIKSYVREELSLLFRQCLANVVCESEAFTGCLITIKKLLYLGSFLSEAELFFEMISSKLLNIQTNAQYKLEILKCLKDLLNNEIVADMFVSLDCDLKRKNSIETILKTIATLYGGLPVPEGIVHEEDQRVRKLCYDIMTDMISSLAETNKKMDPFNPAGKLAERKVAKKTIDLGIIEFNNKDIKPQKSLKKLAALGAFDLEPTQIAKFLHKNIDSLSSVKIGEMIGGHTDINKTVLNSFSQIIDFSNMEIDGGLRHLLDHFTIPGEGQQVDRIIESFSIKFYQDNPGSVFASNNPVYSLSYLMMMLQTNLHNPQVQDKMKFAEFTKLSKGMNDKADFPVEYLQSLYNSIQRSQLGFHQKQKEKDFVSAYAQGGRKLADLYQKDLDKMVKRVYSQFRTFGPVTDFRPRVSCVPLLIDAACGSIVSVLISCLESVEQKEACTKIIEYMEAVINLCINNSIKTGQELLIQELSKRVPDELVTIKQLLFTEAILDWSFKYTEHINKSWRFVFSVISKFSRRKAIVKTKEVRKPLVVMNERVALQEGFVQQLLAKSGELPEPSTIAILNGLLEVSKEQIRDNELIYCLQKVGDFVEYNLPRIGEVFNSLWPLLRDYYFELGVSPNEKVALFGVDFLKQTITKLMKKKETLALQKEFFKPYEVIFANTNLLSIKEFIICTIIYLCTHNAVQLRYGWRVILSILASSFEDSEPAEIKAKSYQALNKLVESNLAQLQEFYIDLTQILVKLTRQKQQVYVAGCITFVKEIIEYYNKKLNIQPRSPNPAADISFLQATWLPLLGILSTICGDHRSDLQNTAINYLFALLMDYGCLFKYEFWKMVFQGVLRPTFDEILYTFQIRNSEANKKDTLIWLKTSCEKLFESISQLISVYYEDFRLFLPDIFKIYENCTQHANQLLTKLSINAVKTLIHKVADKFIEEDWQHFLQFFNRLFKKTTPTELLSLEAWKESRQSSEYNQTETYGAKCLSQLMLLGVIEEVLCKFSMHLSEKHLDFLYSIIKESYEFSSSFNKKLQLRNQLWQQGFIAEMKQLPGLLKQERESLKCLILVEYYRYQLAQHGQTQKFEQYVKTVLNVLHMYISKHKELLDPNDNELARQQTEREALNMRILVRDTVIEQIEQNGLNSIVAYRNEFFQAFLQMLKYSSTLKRPCASCKRCEKCTENLPVEIEFDETLNKLIAGIFYLKP